MINLEALQTLNEFADSKKVILQDLYSKRSKFIEHMLLLYGWSNTEYVNGWKKEIYAYFKDISKMKHNNKYPDASDIYSAIFGGYEDVLEARVNKYIFDIVDDKPELQIVSVDPSKFKEFMKKYCIWLASELSTKGEVEKQDVYNKLDELVSK